MQKEKFLFLLAVPEDQLLPFVWMCEQ